MRRRADRGFTLVEVLVALVVVAIGLAALMIAVSGTARTSGYLRDKTLAQWIALNRLAEVRLTVNKQAQSSSSQNGDTGQLDFAGRTWHYDTRYYDTTFQSTKRIVVRVWAGDAKSKSNPLAEATGFFGTALSTPGNSNAMDWTQGTTATQTPCQSPGATPGSGALGTPAAGAGNCNSNGVIAQPGSTPSLPNTGQSTP